MGSESAVSTSRFEQTTRCVSDMIFWRKAYLHVDIRESGLDFERLD